MARFITAIASGDIAARERARVSDYVRALDETEATRLTIVRSMFKCGSPTKTLDALNMLHEDPALLAAFEVRNG